MKNRQAVEPGYVQLMFFDRTLDKENPKEVTDGTNHNENSLSIRRKGTSKVPLQKLQRSEM